MSVSEQQKYAAILMCRKSEQCAEIFLVALNTRPMSRTLNRYSFLVDALLKAVREFGVVRLLHVEHPAGAETRDYYPCSSDPGC
jgi:hypothetical protein